MIQKIPDEILIAIGVLVLMNIGSVASMFLSSFKIGRWVGKMEGNDKRNYDLAVSAHKRLNDHLGVRQEQNHKEV